MRWPGLSASDRRSRPGVRRRVGRRLGDFGM